jgi:hypothetical protein
MIEQAHGRHYQNKVSQWFAVLAELTLWLEN